MPLHHFISVLCIPLFCHLQPTFVKTHTPEILTQKKKQGPKLFPKKSSDRKEEKEVEENKQRLPTEPSVSPTERPPKKSQATKIKDRKEVKTR
jgi:hypothetical protein